MREDTTISQRPTRGAEFYHYRRAADAEFWRAPLHCGLGDTSLTPEVAALRGIDIAILAVRNPYMMSQEEIVQAASVMQPKVVIPVEWLPSESEEIVYIRDHMPAGVQFKVLPRS